jgi:hypothetical protein
MSKLDFSDLGEDFSEDLVKAKSTHADEGMMGQTRSEIAGAMFESKCPVRQCRAENATALAPSRLRLIQKC